jgi:hypothetical protein
MARGAALRGRRIAFGDGRRICWDHNSPLIFKSNPNIAPPGSEHGKNLEWIDFRKGHRQYNSLDPSGRRWVWNMEFRAKAGEVFLDPQEIKFAELAQIDGCVVIEPNTPHQKSCSPNKQWPFDRYEAVARELTERGLTVVQMISGPRGYRLRSGRKVGTETFRHALAILQRSALYIGCEGGLHHGAAAVGIPAVVLFGGFIPPQVTGYDTHINLTGGAEACGSLRACNHCRQAMAAISAENVLESIRGLIRW